MRPALLSVRSVALGAWGDAEGFSQPFPPSCHPLKEEAQWTRTRSSVIFVNTAPRAFSCEFLKDSGLIPVFVVFCSFAKSFRESLGTVALGLASQFHFNLLSYFLET